MLLAASAVKNSKACCIVCERKSTGDHSCEICEKEKEVSLKKFKDKSVDSPILMYVSKVDRGK